jgi:hypothetical protein
MIRCPAISVESVTQRRPPPNQLGDTGPHCVGEKAAMEAARSFSGRSKEKSDSAADDGAETSRPRGGAAARPGGSRRSVKAAATVNLPQ